MSLLTIGRPILRKLLFSVLRTDPDLDAFCLDYFPDVQRRFTRDMDRESKVNLLLELEENATIFQFLKEAHPTVVERQLTGLLGSSALPISAVPSPPVITSVPRQGVKSTSARVYKWDFFIAHAAADSEPAGLLYELLKKSRYRPYFDKQCLLPGDDWNVELPQAQRQSRMTIVLVSSNCEGAYYQREEIVAAVAMARDEKYRHRVVPVYLSGWPRDATDVPYGLHSKHGLSLVELGGMPGIAREIDELMVKLREREAEESS